MYLAHLNWQEAEKVFAKEDLVALVPVGSTEQHGPIGPLGTDFIIPTALAADIEARTEVLVVPTMPFGVAAHHTSFPGTIDIGVEGLYAVMKGVVDNLTKHGVKRILFLNGHGGNTPVLERVALEAYRGGALCALIDWWSLAPELDPAWRGGHGDGQEVSMLMSIDENLVHKDYLIPTNVSHLSDALQNVYLNLVRFNGASVKIVRDVRGVVDSGGFGGSDSGQASKELGQSMRDGVASYIVSFIEEFKKLQVG